MTDLITLPIQIHNLQQGSREWHRYRAEHFNASDASAMLGCSPYKTRDELLLQLHTGIDAEVDERTQARYDAGHRVEALARPLASDALMADLVPMVVSRGKYSASLDGAVPFPLTTIAFTILWEHKQLNDALRAAMIEGATGADLPKHYRVQMEQQLIVTDATEVLFTASDWDGDTLIEARHVTYISDPALRAEILAGWDLLEEELVSYVPPTGNAIVIARQFAAIPALQFDVRGDLKVEHNLPVYHEALQRFVAAAPKNPTTDQEFADAESAGKKGRDIADVAKRTKADLLRRVGSLNEAMGVLDAIEKLGNELGKNMEKLVDRRKTEVKAEMAQTARNDLAAEVDALNAGLGEQLLQPIGHTVGEFGDAIKGKRNFDSMQAAVNVALAQLKIAARQQADVYRANLAVLKGIESKHNHLFEADRRSILAKAPDDFAMLVSHRCAEYDRKEAERIADENKRIRAAGIQGRIDVLRKLGQVTDATAPVVIRSNIATATDMLILAGDYDERLQEAQDLRTRVLEDLRAVLTAIEARELAAREAAEVAANEPAINTAQTSTDATAIVAPESQSSPRAADRGNLFHYRPASPRAAPEPQRATAEPDMADMTTVTLGAICAAVGVTVRAADMSEWGFTAVSLKKPGVHFYVRDFPRIKSAICKRVMEGKLDTTQLQAAV